jgi:hypothetical protein
MAEQRWTITVCPDCGLVNPPRFPESVCLKGTGPLGHATETVEVVPASALATAEAERDEARADRDNFSALLSADNLAEEELRARAEAAEAQVEAVREWTKDSGQRGFGGDYGVARKHVADLLTTESREECEKLGHQDSGMVAPSNPLKKICARCGALYLDEEK